jgi:hypothetical protein
MPGKQWLLFSSDLGGFPPGNEDSCLDLRQEVWTPWGTCSLDAGRVKWKSKLLNGRWPLTVYKSGAEIDFPDLAPRCAVVAPRDQFVDYWTS